MGDQCGNVPDDFYGIVGSARIDGAAVCNVNWGAVLVVAILFIFLGWLAYVMVRYG